MKIAVGKLHSRSTRMKVCLFGFLIGTVVITFFTPTISWKFCWSRRLSRSNGVPPPDLAEVTVVSAVVVVSATATSSWAFPSSRIVVESSFIM